MEELIQKAMTTKSTRLQTKAHFFDDYMDHRTSVEMAVVGVGL